MPRSRKISNVRNRRKDRPLSPLAINQHDFQQICSLSRLIGSSLAVHVIWRIYSPAICSVDIVMLVVGHRRGAQSCVIIVIRLKRKAASYLAPEMIPRSGPVSLLSLSSPITYRSRPVSLFSSRAPWKVARRRQTEYAKSNCEQAAPKFLLVESKAPLSRARLLRRDPLDETRLT